MEKCPFCNASVEPQLIVHGGTCPMCFGEIPGEEAPTNPGEEVKRKQEAADRRGLRLRAMMTLVFGGVVFASVLCVAGGLVLYPKEDKLAAVNFDDYEGWDNLEELAFVEAAPEPEVAAADPKAAGTKPNTAKANGTKVNTTISGFDPSKIDLGTPNLGDIATADPSGAPTGPRGPRSSQAAGTADIPTQDIPSLTPSTSGLSGLSGLTGGGVKRSAVPNITLTDDNEIIQMAARVLSTEMKGLKSCYEQELKTTEDGFSGRWVVSLVIGKDGVPKNVSVTPAETQPRPAMEACMVAKAQRWRFQPIKADFEVSKSARFSPN